MLIHKKNDGETISHEHLLWEFIKSINQVEEFELFRTAIVKESSEIR